MPTELTDGGLTPAELRVQSGENMLIFKDTFCGAISVRLGDKAAMIRREEIAALAALFPVEHRSVCKWHDPHADYVSRIDANRRAEMDAMFGKKTLRAP